MALRSSSSARTPVISGVEPRGRPGMAALGLVVLAGGIVLWVLAGQGVVPLAPVTTTNGHAAASNTPSPIGLSPTGSRPTDFLVYADPQGRFALFVSNGWQNAPGTLTINGQSQPTTVFAPKASSLPNWRIAFPTMPIPRGGASYNSVIANIVQAEGGSNFSPTNLGLTPVQIGGYQWWRLDATAELQRGAMVHLVALTQMLANGQSVLILETELALNFTKTESQDFTPMLQSLVLKD